jgi:hypothetical protein
MEIVFEIIPIWMGAGKFCPGISYRTQSAAVIAFGTFYGLFFH